MKIFAISPRQMLAATALSILFLGGCSNGTGIDSTSVKYANQNSPGAKLDVKSVLVPDQMNLVYFYADW